jgi:hypothetical protein
MHRGRNRHADAAACPGVSIGHVGRALFVPDQDVVDRVFQHRVIGRQNRAAGIPKDGLHALVGQALPDDLRAGSYGHVASVPERRTSVKLIVIHTS